LLVVGAPGAIPRALPFSVGIHRHLYSTMAFEESCVEMPLTSINSGLLVVMIHALFPASFQVLDCCFPLSVIVTVHVKMN
jgi:hypothetical protein